MNILRIFLFIASLILGLSIDIVVAEDSEILKENRRLQKKKKIDSTETNILQLETFVVESKAESEDKQHIENRLLRSHKIVDLAEILSAELVEVQMIRKSGYGNEVSMRGFGQENMKVLLDGGILEGACGSRKDPSLSHINMLTVQNMVIRQGPFDVTKPGCLGGYVDVITKKPESEFEGEILGKTGSYGFYSSGLSLSGGDDKVQGLFGYNYSESGQYEDGSGDELWTVREGLGASYNAKGRDAKAFRKNDVWGKLQITPTEQQTILLEHTYGKAEDILTPRVIFDTEREITNMTKISWEIAELAEFSKKLTLSFYRNEVKHYPFQDFRNELVPKDSEVESVITGGGIKNVTEADVAIFTYGIDTYCRDWQGDVYNSLTGVKINDNLVPSVETLNIGTYFQVDRKFEEWSLGMGVRFDYFRQKAGENLLFSSSVTNENRRINNLLGGHISGKYFLSENSMLFGGIGRSYRTPTSTERYIQGSGGYFGNPELDPTANTELDLGYKYENNRLMLQVKGFYSDLNDYIYQENNIAGYKSYANIDAHIYGGDIKVAVDLIDGFSLEGGLAYQRGRKDSHPDNNNDDDLGQIAPLKSRIALNYSQKILLDERGTGIFGTLEWVHSSRAKDVDESAGERQFSAWDIMNLRVGYQFNKACTLNLGVDNVFDRKYTVANSYEWDVMGGVGANPATVNEPGRFLYASLNYQF